MSSMISKNQIRTSKDGNGKAGKDVTNQSTEFKQSLRGSSYDSPSRQDRRHLGFLETEEPEMVIPDGVEIKGDIEYDRYLYVDGSIEGNIITGLNFDLCLLLLSSYFIFSSIFIRPRKFVRGAEWGNYQ